LEDLGSLDNNLTIETIDKNIDFVIDNVDKNVDFVDKNVDNKVEFFDILDGNAEPAVTVKR
jgi:hypothetical protein